LIVSDDSMLELFRQEAETQIALLTQELLILEANPQSDEALEALMRAAHSIKGAARIVSLDAVTTLAHWMEDCFIAAQSQIITLGSDQIDVLLQSVDLLQGLSQVMEVELLEWLAQKAGEFECCYEAIAALLPPNFRAAGSKSLVPVDRNSALSQSEGQEIATAQTLAIPTDRVVRVTAENLNRIMGLAGESLVEANWLQPPIPLLPSNLVN
jgi:two-component system sensor histidine kinase and response regulator WspE